MPIDAPYDAIAAWYEDEFLARQRTDSATSTFADRLGIDQALVELLGRGQGPCLEIGCGTGIYADRVRQLGWQPLGVDISSGMLARARPRLPVALADAARLPVANASVAAAIAVMVHTDLVDYAPVLAEVERVLQPGGVLAHVGVHPCFCGGFADRSDLEAIVIRPGYLDGQWTKKSWTDQGLRDKVGASHLPLAGLVNAFVAAGFRVDRLSEGGEPTPVVLSCRLIKPA